MKYNNTNIDKKNAYNRWKKKDRTPEWAKINKKTRCFDAKFYKTLNNIQNTLKFLNTTKHDTYKKCDLEHLGYYLNNIDIQQRVIEHPDSMKHSIFWWVSSRFPRLLDQTGYNMYWKIEEVNYSRLAEKMLGITYKNKLKQIEGDRWLVWVKITLPIANRWR